MKRILFALLLLVAAVTQAQEISIIPKPVMMDVKKEKFLFNGKIVICYPDVKDELIKNVIDNFVNDFEVTTGVKLCKSTFKKKKNCSGEVTASRQTALSIKSERRKNPSSISR